MKYRQAVFIVAYAETKKGREYLLLKRKLHWKGWECPKGGVEKGESLIKAVKRELKEETGLKALRIKKWNYKKRYKYDLKTRKERGYIGQFSTLFSVEVKKGRIKVDKREHYLGKWFGFKQAIKKLKWKDQKECLKMVEKLLESKIR